jgi:hypothetical protein
VHRRASAAGIGHLLSFPVPPTLPRFLASQTHHNHYPLASSLLPALTTEADCLLSRSSFDLRSLIYSLWHFSDTMFVFGLPNLLLLMPPYCSRISGTQISIIFETNSFSIFRISLFVSQSDTENESETRMFVCLTSRECPLASIIALDESSRQLSKAGLPAVFALLFLIHLLSAGRKKQKSVMLLPS